MSLPAFSRSVLRAPFDGEHGSVAQHAVAQSQKAQRDTARILRAHRLDELLAGIREWQRSTGPERAYARRNAAHDLRQWRRLYAQPERAAFDAAVQRSKLRRAAA